MSDKAAQKENPELSGQKFLTKKVLSERMQSYGFAHYPYPVKCRALGLRQCHSPSHPPPQAWLLDKKEMLLDRIQERPRGGTRHAMDDVL